ncbi:hypothetical protein PR048_032544 [Dryococelus australis]|uniref:Uncharacterized protein n=1 Tax=Dryococelus australis TaxID=614101 RepID=A0ABQ9G5M5_9NEOP|nr:hypothetical protein PR048_032544 [Dryococelus australis]
MCLYCCVSQGTAVARRVRVETVAEGWELRWWCCGISRWRRCVREQAVSNHGTLHLINFDPRSGHVEERWAVRSLNPPPPNHPSPSSTGGGIDRKLPREGEQGVVDRVRPSRVAEEKPASFLHWLLPRCEVTPFLSELYVIGAHDCQVVIYWRRVTRGVSYRVLSNDNRIAKASVYLVLEVRCSVFEIHCTDLRKEHTSQTRAVECFQDPTLIGNTISKHAKMAKNGFFKALYPKLYVSDPYKTSQGACIDPSYTLSTNKIIGSPLKVP